MEVDPINARRQYLIGCTLLLGVVSSWVIGGFIMNSMFTEMDYNKPFLITYICTATFVLYLARPLVHYLKAQYYNPREDGGESGKSGQITGYEPLGSYVDEHGLLVIRPDFVFRSRSVSHSRSISLAPIPVDEVLSTRETATLAAGFMLLWFLANYSMNASLGLTSVSSSTILSSMSGFFTLLIGCCFGVEQFNKTKFFSVALSILGVMIVSKSDHEIDSSPSSPSNALLGDGLALISAIAYGFYVILLKVKIKNQARISMSLFFGFVGLFNIILVWPFGLLLDYSDIETFQWPSGRDLILGIVINAAITFVSDVLYLRAMLMTSPLSVTLGMSLTIPFAMAGDAFRGHQKGGWTAYLGGGLVLFSFLANGLVDLRQTTQDEAVDRSTAIEAREAVGVRERDGLLSSSGRSQED